MSIFRVFSCVCVLMFGFTLTGCDSGGGTNEVVSDQSDIERYIAENPNFDEGMDDGSEDDSEE